MYESYIFVVFAYAQTSYANMSSAVMSKGLEKGYEVPCCRECGSRRRLQGIALVEFSA